MKKEKRNVLYYHSTRPDISGLTRKDILQRRTLSCTEAVYGSSKENFTVISTCDLLRCIGPRIFWQNCQKVMLTFKDGKFFGSLNPTTYGIMIKVFHLDWIDMFCRELLRCDKRLWIMVIKGQITNPESLAKRYSRMYFRSAFSYKALRMYFDSKLLRDVSLYDIYYHTTNPELFIRRFVEELDDSDTSYRMRNLLCDTIKYCKYENTRLNSLWSPKRIHEEHLKQIERDTLVEMSKCSDKYIASPFSKEGLSLVLSERDAFKESAYMHNCVYRCYWPEIKRGGYAVAKGYINGEYVNLGMRVEPRWNPSLGLQFDQVHTIYNGSVSPETKDLCLQWIGRWINDIFNICKSIHAIDDTITFDDIPF